MLDAVTRAIGAVTAAGIRSGVRLTGRRIARREAAWLDCPMGPRGKIGGAFYARLAATEGLKILPEAEAGLLPDFGSLRGSNFDPDRIHAHVRDFYEHTSAYRLEAWSEAPTHTRLLLWVLTRFVSRPMEQLNFPVSSAELAGGMSSEILPMISDTGERVYTGWYRRLVAPAQVIYTGLYGVGSPGAFADPCMKVSFPLPLGSATVFLRPEALPDGSLKLISSGSRFGDPGFYRMVESGPDHWRVRYLRTLREEFHVFVDEEGVLRTTHSVWFLGMTILRLHYTLTRSRVPDRVGETRERGGSGSVGISRAGVMPTNRSA